LTWLDPVASLARAEARGRRATIAVIIGVAALVSGATLTAAAGAHRTATVVDRMLAQVDMPAYAVGTYQTVNAGDPDRLRAGEDALEQLSGVDQAIAMSNIYVAIGPADGSWYLSIGTTLDGRYLESGWTPPVREGRPPAVDGRGEVAFDAATASRLGLEVGDEFVAPTISAETTEALITGQASEAVADGPEIPFTVVGIFRESITDDPSFGFGLASPDTAAYLGQAGASEAYFQFDGDDDVDTRAAVDAVQTAMGGLAYFADPDLELGPVRSTIDIIAAGLAIFAVLAAVAGVIALGQVVGRQVADGGRVAGVARALGMRDRETALALALPPSLAGGLGIVVGAIVAVGLSPIFPTGLGRRAEPDPGVRIDWIVLGVGSLLLFAVVSAAAVVSADRRVSVRNDQHRTVHRDRGWGLRLSLPPSAAIGTGLVLVPNRVRSTVRPASALVGTVLGVTGVVAIAVFTVSQRTTADQPTRYGWAWDVDVDLAVDDPEPLLTALAEEPALDAVATATCGQSRVGDDDTLVCALDVLSGSMPMTYLAGRAPSSPDEVAVGRTTMARHGASIGDRLEVAGPTGDTESLEVVGVAVFPDAAAPGDGLIVTPDRLDALDGAGNFPILTLSYAPEFERAEVERILADDYGLSPDELTNATPPSLVTRLDLVRPTLVALAVLLAVLGAIGLLHFLMLSTTRRRQESAVLEAIGFIRAQRIAIVLWQALTIATIGVIVGLPLGLILGRSVWEASIDQLGIVDTATVPWLFVGAVAVAALATAATVGIVTGWQSAQGNTPDSLRQE
jgi:hypothetical protein